MWAHGTSGGVGSSRIGKNISAPSLAVETFLFQTPITTAVSKCLRAARQHDPVGGAVFGLNHAME
jgi:hypothetical protein